MNTNKVLLYILCFLLFSCGKNAEQIEATFLFKFISYLPLGLGFFWILFNKERRGWHDLVAKTHVAIK